MKKERRIIDLTKYPVRDYQERVLPKFAKNYWQHNYFFGKPITGKGHESPKGAAKNFESYAANPDLLGEYDKNLQWAAPLTWEDELRGQIIGRLRGMQKKVYWLIDREKLSYHQAGKKLGLTRAETKQFYIKARAFIQRAFVREVNRENKEL